MTDQLFAVLRRVADSLLTAALIFFVGQMFYMGKGLLLSAKAPWQKWLSRFLVFGFLVAVVITVMVVWNINPV